jgi:catechol 2,3-dioxygenase-like lactoylglutathione lyase family enzyme
MGLGKAVLAAVVMLAAPDTPGTGRPVVRYRPSLLVQLQVSDLERSVRFYTETLGFELTERRDDLQFVHLSCGLQGLQIGLSAGGAPPQAGTVTLNFGVQGDIEDARRALEAKGVVFLGPTRVIPGKVRLAEFRDPDGYRIRLAASDRAAADAAYPGPRRIRPGRADVILPSSTTSTPFTAT